MEPITFCVILAIGGAFGYYGRLFIAEGYDNRTHSYNTIEWNYEHRAY